MLVSLPHVIPLVILRGSGETTAALAREAAQHGVRTLAHAEGGGVLYVARGRRLRDDGALVEASLDRLGVCNRLNLLLVDDRGKRAGAIGLTRSSASTSASRERIGHEWANDPDTSRRVTVDGSSRSLEEAVAIANRRDVRPRRVDRHRGRGRSAALPRRVPRHRGVLERADAVHRRSCADGLARDGHQRRSRHRARAGPVTYRDLWLRQFRVVGDGTQRR